MKLSLEFYVPRMGVAEFFGRPETVSVLTSPGIEMVSVTRGTGEDYCRDKHIETLAAVSGAVDVPGLHRIPSICSHLTLSHLEKTTLSQMKSAGIKGLSEVLCLTGDHKPSEYALGRGMGYSVDLVKYVTARDWCSNVSCHPLGHHVGGWSIGDDVTNTARKVKAGWVHRVISQWTFDQRQQIEYFERLANRLVREGEVVPKLTVGYMPVKDVTHAMRAASACKIYGAPNFMSGSGGANSLKFGLEKAEADFRFLKSYADVLDGVHLFTMNNMGLSSQLLEVWNSI